MTRSCPTPEKVSYASKREAIRHAISASNAHGPVNVYRCPCGRFHLTTKLARLRAAKRAAARRRR